jgi:RNA polymerase sigma-70 factor, ECF subfamily
MHPDDPVTAAPADFDDTFRNSYWPMVRSLSVACGDRDVAEDAVQDGFERAFVRWRRISRYDDPAGWIRHVALNRLRDHFRRDERRRRALERLAAEPDRALHAGGVATDVEALLAGLPQQQRIAAAFFYVEDLSVREVATSMRLSEGAVKYHLHAARSALKGMVDAP